MARREQHQEGGRIPPHNIDAEQSIIGSALLSPLGVAALVDIAPASDFYKPQHQYIVSAILRTTSAGIPVDVVTVGEQLRQDGLLDDAGGIPYLGELQNATPSISAAPHYARTVHDTAVLRRILHSAADIADTAYSSHDPAAALADVARIVEQLGRIDVDDISTLEIADTAEVIANGLDAEDGDFLTRSDGISLLYAGKMHMFQAEPSSGKSWIALAAVDEVLTMGGSAVYIDFEDTARGIIGRLITMRVKPEILGARFRYVQPVGPFGPAEIASLNRLLEDINPDLVIIDGVGEALARDGLSEDKASDYMGWVERVPRPIARTGAAVVLIDHVVKNKDEQGRWARGTGAKLAAIDGASYQLKVVVPFSRSRPGKVKVIVAKDRPGQFTIGEVAALVNITPAADGSMVAVDIEPNVEQTAPGDSWKPTHLMERVSNILEEATVPLTASGIKAMLSHSKPGIVADAIARLIAEGYAAESKGRPKTLRSLRPYTDGATVHHLHTVPPHTDDDVPHDLSDETLFGDPVPHPEDD